MKWDATSLGDSCKWKGYGPFNPAAASAVRFIPRTTDSNHSGPFCANLLLEEDFPTAPGKVLVGDITYIPLAGSEWGYLAAWMDLFSRKIKGWSVACNMEEELVHSALRKAINSSQLTAGSIVHSDRGGQYIGKAFRQTLADHQFRQSMSRADDPYDNAFMPGRRSGVLLVSFKSRTVRKRRVPILGRCAYGIV